MAGQFPVWRGFDVNEFVTEVWNLMSGYGISVRHVGDLSKGRL